MDYYAGIDVSLECSSVCVVDASGKIVREGKVASEPDALIGWLRSLGYELSRIGLEAGPLSQWLFAAMRQAGLTVELLETRHVRKAFEAMPVKSDRNDARGIAQLMRLGWFRPVHCKSMAAQEVRAMLTARKLVQTKLLDVQNSLRGILRGFGLKVGKTTERGFAGRIRELVAGHPALETIAEAVLAVHAVLKCEFDRFEKRVRTMARAHPQAELLMTTPGIGPVIALTYLCICHRRSRTVQVVEDGRVSFWADAEEVPIRRDRLHWPHQQNRRCLGARSALSGGSHHPDQAVEGLFRTQGLGDADRQAGRHAQGQGGAGAQARSDPAPDARQRDTIQRCSSSLTGRSQVFGRVTTPAFPKRSPFAGTMDQVRPSSGMSTRRKM
jgi:transposase